MKALTLWQPDREALEAAVFALADYVALEPELVEGETIAVLAAYFGALEPVLWAVESEGGDWTSMYPSRRYAEEEAATAPFATGRYRPLYPGPIQEASRE